MEITIENIRTLLGWCAVINLGVLLAWYFGFVFARGFIFRMHTRRFRISEERFDEIHYTLMGHYKLAVILFILVPYLVLKLVDFS